jgi:hypothetical protein
MTSDATGQDANGNVLPSTHPTGPFYPPAGTTLPILKGDRRLITLFTQSGMVVTNSIEPAVSFSPVLPSEGFNIFDINQPFYRAQLGQRDASK